MQAFPGAYGWGAEAIGGRGGEIIPVTNLDDSGRGSFRDAILSSGPRIVIFEVAGTIRLLGTIQWAQGFCTIEGQTSPGRGITLVGGGLRCKSAHNIVRYLTWRGGANEFFRTSPSGDCHDVIVDHCSVAWNEDDGVAIDFGSGYPPEIPDVRNITVQNCIMGEALAMHPTAMIIAGTPRRGHHISVHNNLFISNSHRNPQVGEFQNVRIINNVVYNWKNNAMQFKNVAEVDFIGNYFEPGPMTGTGSIFRFEHNNDGQELPSVYIEGNTHGWESVSHHRPPPNYFVDARRDVPLDPAPFPVPVLSASDARELVLNEAGAGDATDRRFINEVRTGTGVSSPPQEKPMSVITDLETIEAALRIQAAALTAEADAVARVVVDLKAVDDVLDAAADVIEED